MGLGWGGFGFVQRKKKDRQKKTNMSRFVFEEDFLLEECGDDPITKARIPERERIRLRTLPSGALRCYDVTTLARWLLISRDQGHPMQDPETRVPFDRNQVSKIFYLARKILVERLQNGPADDENELQGIVTRIDRSGLANWWEVQNVLIHQYNITAVLDEHLEAQFSFFSSPQGRNFVQNQVFMPNQNQVSSRDKWLLLQFDYPKAVAAKERIQTLGSRVSFWDIFAVNRFVVLREYATAARVDRNSVDYFCDPNHTSAVMNPFDLILRIALFQRLNSQWETRLAEADCEKPSWFQNRMNLYGDGEDQDAMES
jgi:hypothetical protein